MLLYSSINTNRLNYIISFFNEEIEGKTFGITDNTEQFINYTGAKINYSDQPIVADEFWIKPVSLLFETNIQQQKIDFFELNNNKALFKTEGDFPFDVFAATFYLLSRYEEYLPHTKDMYGRYAHTNSLAFHQNFLNIPLVNQWLQMFKKSLNQKFPDLSFKNKAFYFLPTYDVDEAYAYKHKSFLRSIGGGTKSLLQGKWKNISCRLKVLLNKNEDPYDAFEWMATLNQRYNLNPNYFFLVAEQTGKYDKNILPEKKALQKLIKEHSQKYSIGIHPSWQSGDDTSLLKNEIKTLASISGKEISVSRQHFIRFTLPETFRILIDAGIKEDYSMGYGSINGFRASVASPFYWYDLENEKQTNLLLHPFCYMEANSFYEQKISSHEALEEMLHYLNEVRKVNGTLITIWHNTFLGTESIYKGWREAYEQFIKEVNR